MKELAMSYRSACLHCSLFDKDLSEYIQWKKRNSGHLPLKYAVAHVGIQEDGTWVVGEDGCISPRGESIPIEESRYVWISNVYSGVGVAYAANYRTLPIIGRARKVIPIIGIGLSVRCNPTVSGVSPRVLF